jgi:hypothetical protein
MEQMATKELKDSNGHLLGKIDVRNDGTEELYDKTGWLKGRYSPQEDQTFDDSGHLVGQGDLLTMLL